MIPDTCFYQMGPCWPAIGWFCWGVIIVLTVITTIRTAMRVMRKVEDERADFFDRLHLLDHKTMILFYKVDLLLDREKNR